MRGKEETFDNMCFRNCTQTMGKEKSERERESKILGVFLLLIFGEGCMHFKDPDLSWPSSVCLLNECMQLVYITCVYICFVSSC